MAIDAGTRDEREGEYGIAHFCEHMLFKGTTHRRSWHILNRMEAVGGDLNAYTNKEETVVYTAFMKDHLHRAVNLISDIVFHSTFPQHELEKEAEVVVEEIESYNDSPAELIFDEFEDMLFEGHELGHDILGKIEDVRGYRSEDLQQFVNRMYRPERMVFFVFGDYEFNEVRRTIEKETSFLKPIDDNTQENKGKAEVLVREKAEMEYAANHRTVVRDTHQAHVMLGCRAYPSSDKRRVALYFLNNILGGPGMNSLLNVALREHKGLVYTVESSLTNYTDTATFSIYFGCDPQDVEKCLRTVRKELDKLMSTPLSNSKFSACMKQIKGQIGVSCDNFENYALDMAKSFLHYNKFEGVKETFAQLDTLTPKMVQAVAKDLFKPERLSLLVYNR